MQRLPSLKLSLVKVLKLCEYGCQRMQLLRQGSRCIGLKGRRNNKLVRELTIESARLDLTLIIAHQEIAKVSGTEWQEKAINPRNSGKMGFHGSALSVQDPYSRNSVTLQHL